MRAARGVKATQHWLRVALVYGTGLLRPICFSKLVSPGMRLPSWEKKPFQLHPPSFTSKPSWTRAPQPLGFPFHRSSFHSKPLVLGEAVVQQLRPAVHSHADG